MNRREFMVGVGSVAFAATLPDWMSAKIPTHIAQAKQASFIPVDKGFSKEWLSSLSHRTGPTKYRGAALHKIGMPVGGIGCGQVYFSGDGRLWWWDIMHQKGAGGGVTTGAHYSTPSNPTLLADRGPVDVSFHLGVGDRYFELNSDGVGDIEFEGRYPVGVVRFTVPNATVELNAFSPFIPLNEDDSSLPATLMRYSITNRGDREIEFSLTGIMNNAVGAATGNLARLQRFQSGLRERNLKGYLCWARAKQEAKGGRPEIVFEDFERATYGPWKVEGDAFGDGPFPQAKMPPRKSPAKGHGNYLVNSHESRHEEDSGKADLYVGKLTSPTFKIERNFVNFLIGGGSHKRETCLNLIVDGLVVRSAEGRDSNLLRQESFDVVEFAGREAHIEIVDHHKGGWGHICVDYITFSDTSHREPANVEDLPDFGSMAIGIIDSQDTSPGNARGVTETFKLAPGENRVVTFAVTWYFPNLTDAGEHLGALEGWPKLKKHYAKRFQSAGDVLQYVSSNQKRLVGDTLAFAQTWYDSTLPHWFLERTLLNIGCLATATTYRFDNGRFYGWEGIYCCAGTCQHVWNYAQSVAHIFPGLERHTREHTDYGVAYKADGTLNYRAEYGQHLAHDGQAGTIIRTYREHSMSPDHEFLKRIWPKVKKSIERIIEEDTDGDGIWDKPQYNTLDAAWPGRNSWLSSLYLAALRCGAAMAKDMGDGTFAAALEARVKKGSASIVRELYNGEFFIMVRDPKHPEALGYGKGCHIDQVLGDSWLHQVGLDPVLPQAEVRKALKALFTYNFAPDAGGYRNSMQTILRGGRWYALAGEPGLIMTTFPNGGSQESKGQGHEDWIVGYFNECMSGFEHQAAAHMIAEGMVTEGLAITRAVHDRYDGNRRNPYNEIECSDHYSRAMASYGQFLTMCGFRYHGPSGRMSFAPKLTGKFRVPFTAATGWGTVEIDGTSAKLHVVWGTVSLHEISFGKPVKSASVSGTPIVGMATADGFRFDAQVQVKTGQVLMLTA